MENIQRFDFLVIGGGAAGLTFALEAAAHGSVAVLFKRSPEESSTAWAQGGIAAVSADDDDSSLHAQDTHIAGAGLCNPQIVDIVVREGPQRVQDLVTRGAQFDHQGTNFALHREGGHSRRRILHAGDSTGREVQRALLAAAKANSAIQFFAHTLAIDLITSQKLNQAENQPNLILGAYVLGQDGQVGTFLAEKVLVASGGAGKVYLYTSNPDVATGDGIAMCFRAGCAVANMEFFQFHPTCLYHPQAKSFLISEALRGEGAKLKRINGDCFMQRYDSRAELAPRDIVARAIDNEMKTHGEDHVLLDLSHRGEPFVKEHFPQIYSRCRELGINPGTQPIPVVPAAHYCCGGVVSDEHGRTSIQNLYVAGECSCTGLHGANRLASNSLLETLVFGHRAAQDAIKTRGARKLECTPPPWERGCATMSNEQVLVSHTWEELRRAMWNYVGIVRSDKRLELALRRANLIAREVHDYYWNYIVDRDLLELRNITLVAQLVIHSALRRRESRGLHFTTDYPETKEAYACDTVLDAKEWYHYARTLAGY